MFTYIIFNILAAGEIPPSFPQIDFTMPKGVFKITETTTESSTTFSYKINFLWKQLMEKNNKTTVSHWNNDFIKLFDLQIYSIKTSLNITDDLAKKLFKKIFYFGYEKKENKDGKSTYQLNFSKENLEKSQKEFFELCSKNSLDTEKTLLVVVSNIINLKPWIVQLPKVIDAFDLAKQYRVKLFGISIDSPHFTRGEIIKQGGTSEDKFYIIPMNNMYKILNEDRLINQSIESLSLVRNPDSASAQELEAFFEGVKGSKGYVSQLKIKSDSDVFDFDQIITNFYNSKDFKKN